MKNSFACSVLLVLCVDAAVAQFIGPQTQQFDLTRQRVLSPQQQGHILSDIQQHHRFNPQPSFAPLQFGQRQNNFQQLRPTQQNVINGQQNIFPTQQNLLNSQNLLSNQQILPTNSALNIEVQNQQSFPPTAPTLNNRQVVQHHTQTSFTPNFNQQAAQQFSQFSVGQNPQGTLDPEKQKQRLLELKEKQAIIDKHNQFVEKQYEKALKKAQADHLEFIENQQEEKKKLYQSLYKSGGYDNFRFAQTQPRYIYPEETELFKLAVKKYYEEHPTTTTTTTTTTTPKPTTQKSRPKDEDSERFLNSKDFKSVTEESQSAASSSSGKISFLPTVLPTRKSIQSVEDLNLLQKQYKTQQIKKDDLLAQLRLAIGETGEEELTKNITSREISLPNGQKIEIIRTTDPKLVPGAKPLDLEALGLKPSNGKPLDLSSLGLQSAGGKALDLSALGLQSDGKSLDLSALELQSADGKSLDLSSLGLQSPDGKPLDLEALGLKPSESKSLDLKALGIAPQVSSTARPPNEVLEELTKGVLPPGANFELLKQGSGGLETVGGLPQNLPNQKKVTFVLLEEQNDGSFKVQGVKGNAKDKADVDVDSILKKIKDGEIKLPPNTKLQGSTPSTTTESSISSSTEGKTTMEIIPSISIQPNSIPPEEEDFASTPILKTNIGTQFVASPTPSLPSSTFYTTSNDILSTTPSPKPSPSPSPRSINAGDFDSIRLSSSNDLIRQASTSSTINQNSIFSSPRPTNPTFSSTNPTFSSTFSNPTSSVTIIKSHSTVLPTISTTPEEEEDDFQQELPDVLKRNGLFAMARFLRQSGLDTILNETGPYTVFVPTDKAFRTLLVQLGGPEKAEEKFKENPRLLSGLLLHHVIPGAFKIDSLQDEMTGVSLAGTQLRVNQYNMHDLEWNDVKITTINGAKIMDEKKDIEIPQGVAHSIDRVMFPLPVGDIVQTLQSDRERRFTSFLRALFASGLAETLQGSKTFTLFAPTDKAFTSLSSEDLTRTVSDRSLSRELVMRHLTPGTLYTNGMRYYQIRDSLEANRQITLSKSSGRIKVNNNQIITQNIPATNGVIHALDTLL